MYFLSSFFFPCPFFSPRFFFSLSGRPSSSPLCPPPPSPPATNSTTSSVRRLLDPEVHHTKTIVRQNDVDQILADVVDVAFHSRQNDGRFLRSCFLLHLRFEISDRLLHHTGCVEHRRQLHLSRAEQVADGLHSIQKDRVYEI